jgi:hypothetical protein
MAKTTRRDFLWEIFSIGTLVGLESLLGTGCAGFRSNTRKNPPELPQGGKAFYLTPIYDGTSFAKFDAVYDLAQQRYGLSNFRVVLVHNGGKKEEEEFDKIFTREGKRKELLENALHIDDIMQPDGYVNKERLVRQLAQHTTERDIVYVGGHGNAESVQNNMTLDTPKTLRIIHEVDDFQYTPDLLLMRDDLNAAIVIPLNCSANSKYGVIIKKGGKENSLSGVSGDDTLLMIRGIIEGGVYEVFVDEGGRLQVKKEYIPKTLEDHKKHAAFLGPDKSRLTWE